MVLHCNGDAGEMAEVAAAAPELAGAAAARAEAALALRAGGAGGRPRRWRRSSPRCGSGRMPEDFFDAEGTAARLAAEALVVDVDGYEGPLDLLLTLARSQKVDLRRISILRLAEQYLGFVEAAKRLRIELAADYLVMAAWLAYLKSRLLLPPDPAEAGPSGDELAAHLAFQLQRLEAMREAAARLMARDQLGRDVFARGEPQAVARALEGRAHRLAGRPDARLCPDQDPRRLHAAASGARAGLHHGAGAGADARAARHRDRLDAAGGLAAGGVGGRAGAAALGDGGELRGGAGAGEGRAAASSGRTGRSSRSGCGRQRGRRRA